MGFTIGKNVFSHPDTEVVVEALLSFYRQYWRESQGIYNGMDNDGTSSESLEVYDYSPGWVLMDVHPEPIEWIRQRHHYVSRETGCSGFYVYESDGDYWGYEFFTDGETVDSFISDCRNQSELMLLDSPGNANVVCKYLPNLDIAEFEKYLVRFPEFSDSTDGDREEHTHYERYNLKPRPGDRVRRWDEAASINFIEFLGIQHMCADWSQIIPDRKPVAVVNNRRFIV